jgi:hypothetical protein
MKYLVEVEVTDFYRVVIEAENKDLAIFKASNMEFSEMKDMENGTVEFTVLEEIKE